MHNTASSSCPQERSDLEKHYPEKISVWRHLFSSLDDTIVLVPPIEVDHTGHIESCIEAAQMGDCQVKARTFLRIEWFAAMSHGVLGVLRPAHWHETALRIRAESEYIKYMHILAYTSHTSTYMHIQINTGKKTYTYQHIHAHSNADNTYTYQHKHAHKFKYRHNT